MVGGSLVKTRPVLSSWETGIMCKSVVEVDIDVRIMYLIKTTPSLPVRPYST